MSHPAIYECVCQASEAWRPPPRLSVGQWADNHRYLSPEASAEPGLWRTSRAPHTAKPMSCLTPAHPAERVVCKWSSQTGKTELILNFIGYIMDLDPGPILAIQPNVTPMGEAFSKDRIAPMLRDSPSLAAKMGLSKGRQSTNTVTHKIFPGGHLTIAGANSPAGLASRPIRYLVGDEVDRWEITKEGDPLLLARKRLQTFKIRRSAKELLVSSPTYDDVGISAEYDACEQLWQWHLVCPICMNSQMPQLKHFVTDDGPLRYKCEHCGTHHGTQLEDSIKATGRWVCSTHEGDRSVGFWMNQWASPFARWEDTVQEWRDAGNDSARQQAVVNTVFAEGWEGQGERVEPSALAARAVDLEEPYPSDIKVVTIGCDVQQDRLELEVVGWNSDSTSWSLAYHVLPGDPTSPDVWSDLMDVYEESYALSNGKTISASILCVDSGAYTQHVYDFVRRNPRRNIVPIKGMGGMERDAIAGDRRQRLKRAAKRALNGSPPELLGVDSIKRTIYHHLNYEQGSPGCCYFPKSRSEEYYLQLTGERLQVVVQRGKRPQRKWVPVHSAVEALDCRVYAYAGLILLGSSGSMDEQKQPRKESAEVVAEERSPIRRKARPARYNVRGWRN